MSNLILPLPRRAGDDVLEAIGAHKSLDEDETPYETAPDAGGEDSEPDSAVAEESEPEEGVERSVEGEQGEPDSAVAEEDLGACEDDVPHASEVAVARPLLSGARAEHLQSSQSLLAAFQQAMDV